MVAGCRSYGKCRLKGSKLMKARFVRLAVWAVLVTLGLTGAAQHGCAYMLVSSGFWNDSSHAYSGVESLAQSANPAAFGAANYWNPLTMPWTPTLTNNPSYSNLLDYNGNPTPVGLQFTGSVSSYYSPGGGGGHAVFGSWIYLNGGTLDWEITGLTPNGLANMYFYGYGDNTGQSYRTFTMALDMTGGGTLNASYTVDYLNGVYVPNIQISPTGTIIGEMQYLGGQASWSGFQIEVPEPSSYALLGLGLGGLAVARRFRRRA